MALGSTAPAAFAAFLSSSAFTSPSDRDCGVTGLRHCATCCGGIAHRPRTGPV
jgi:hypothetical protein